MPRPSWSFRKKSSAIGLVAVVGVLLWSGAFAQQAVQTDVFTIRPEEDLLLLAVRVQRELLTDTLVAYPLEGSVIVPLGEMARLLDFAIDVDVASRTASGFFIREDRRFELDVTQRRVSVEGIVSTFDAEQVEVHQDDIYVDAELLARWFPLDVSVNLYGALITIQPREPLPLQIRTERERKIAAGLASMARGPSYPVSDHAYSPFGSPAVDQSLMFERRPREGEETFRQVRQSTYVASDLLWGEATAFVTGDDDDPGAESRFSWGRRDPSGALLGRLGATEAVIGDSSFPGSDLIVRPASGSGLLLTNYPLTRVTQFDAHTFRGELPPGWDVELYRNGALLDYQRSRADGLYEFTDVPVLFGMNVFRLVFYGPQGQRREQTEIFNVGQMLSPPGEFRYRLAHADPRGISRRSLAQFEYGLSRNASAELSLLQLGDSAEDEARYAKATLYTASRAWFGQLDAIREEDGGSLLGLGASTQLRALNLSVRWALLDDFESEELLPRFGEIRSRGEFHLTGIAKASRFQVPVTLEVEHDGLVDGGAAYTVRNALSTYYRGFAATNRIQGTWFSGARPELRSFAQGSFILSRWLRGESIRGEVGYELRPDARVSMVQAVFDTRRFAEYLLSAGVSRNVPDHETTWLLGASKRAGAFGIAVNLDYSDDGLGIRALVNVGLGHDGSTGRWFSSARSVASSGSVSVLVFRDDDGDGEKDVDEAPLPGVTFFINRASSRIVTDASGQALFSGLPPYAFTDIAVSAASLEDPYLVPSQPGFRFVPRPGSVKRLLFPVRMTGEVTGTAYVLREGKLQEAPGIQVELVAADGTLAHEARSEYDGFFDIPMIMPGTYTLRVSPAQEGRIGMKAAPRKLTIGPDGSVLDGVDLELRPAASSQ